MAKIRKDTIGRFIFFCPACQEGHVFTSNWTFNGDMEKPTVQPSILTWRDDAEKPMRCHSFITDGKIQFLGDCLHTMAGQIVELPDF